MVNVSAFQREFQDATCILACSARSNCVVVRPATAVEFVDEFQVLTEKKYQRLLRVGLRLAPGADLEELYCFRYVPTNAGLTVNVLRLVQESQIRTRRSEGKLQVWKVEKTPIWSMRREEVEEQILSKRTGSGDLDSESAARNTLPHSRSGVELGLDCKDEVRVQGKRGRREIDDLGVPGAGSKGTIDKLPLLKKMRRINCDRKEKRAVVDQFYENHGNETSTKWLVSEVDPAQFVTIVEGCDSSTSSPEAVDNVDKGKQDISSAVQSDKCDSEDDSDVSEDANMFSTLQKVVAAGMCFDADDDLGSYTSDQAIFQAPSTSAVLNWTRSTVADVTTHAHTLLNMIRSLTHRLRDNETYY